MKLKVIIGAVFFLSVVNSCDKGNECENVNPVCSETPATDEICAAYFTRWFYNEETNSCEQIGYSGCEAYGFETKEECENCGCK